MTEKGSPTENAFRISKEVMQKKENTINRRNEKKNNHKGT
jgi:hypothetical protein